VKPLDQRNGGILKEVLGLQVKGAFKDVSAEDAAKCVLAYDQFGQLVPA
jgi:hypothetical protein